MMKMMKLNEKQAVKHIAWIIHDKPEKMRQLETVQDISIHLTSDDSISIKCELYAGNIVRYLITGTRSQMTITADTITRQIIRKPRNIKPAFEAETYGTIWCSDILKAARAI